MNTIRWDQRTVRNVVWAALLVGSVLLPTFAQTTSAPNTHGPMAAKTDPSATVNSQVFQRVTAQLNGVFSPRGYFNIMVRVEKLRGVVRAKLDLKKSQMTLDFLPGVAVSPEEIRSVMVNAGYTPGPFKIENIPVSAPPDNRPGWIKIKHPHSRSAFVRWLEINF